MAGAAVAVVLEEELLGNVDIPILRNIWRRLVLLLLSRGARISAETSSSGVILEPCQLQLRKPVTRTSLNQLLYFKVYKSYY